MGQPAATLIGQLPVAARETVSLPDLAAVLVNDVAVRERVALLLVMARKVAARAAAWGLSTAARARMDGGRRLVHPYSLGLGGLGRSSLRP